MASAYFSGVCVCISFNWQPSPKKRCSVFGGFPLGWWGICWCELLLVVVIKSQKNVEQPAPGASRLCRFLDFNGFVISYTLSFYNIGSIFKRSLLLVACLSAWALSGSLLKRFDRPRQAAIGLLIGVIVMGLLNALVFKSGQMDILITCVTIVVFSGLTAYDHQRIKVSYNTNGNNSGFAIIMALNLYLDFINLFLSILRLTGGGSSD